jgi:poly-gamma-glutamate synthesis protein (capsule biosynthesis protein)
LWACEASINPPLKVAFVGDLLLDRGIRTKIENQGIETLIDSSIIKRFRNSKIVIANLECPVTSIKSPIQKKYIFRGEPEWLHYLKASGITHLNMANNHSMDQGRKGLISTRENILSENMIPTGTGINEEDACSPLLISKSPRNIYLLSSVQVASENWTYLPKLPGVCEESVKTVSERITSLRQNDEHCIIIAQLHWGIEHQLKPTLSQKQIAHSLIDAGSDIIIGHHPHVIQTNEVYKSKHIFYSIGNFVFDQKDSINCQGKLVELKINNDEIIPNQIEFKIQNFSPTLK